MINNALLVALCAVTAAAFGRNIDTENVITRTVTNVIYTCPCASAHPFTTSTSSWLAWQSTTEPIRSTSLRSTVSTSRSESLASSHVSHATFTKSSQPGFMSTSTSQAQYVISTSSSGSKQISSGSTTSTASSTTASAPQQTFVLEVSVPSQRKRSSSVLTFDSTTKEAIIVDSNSWVNAFQLLDSGVLAVAGSTGSSVGVLSGDGLQPLRWLDASSSNLMLTGWTATNAVLAFPGVTFCISADGKFNVVFGNAPDTCVPAQLTANAKTSAFSISLPGVTITTSTTTRSSTTIRPFPTTSHATTPSTTTATSTTSTSTTRNCFVDTPDPTAACQDGRIYQVNGKTFQEYCGAILQGSLAGQSLQAADKSYNACAKLCSQNPSCSGFGAPPNGVDGAGPCYMFSGMRVYQQDQTSGMRAGMILASLPCGSDSVFATSATSQTTANPSTTSSAQTTTSVSSASSSTA